MKQVIKIKGVGRYIPPKFETSMEVASRLGISEAEILLKTGIEKRHLAGDEAASSMGQKALLEAIETSQICKDQIGGILVATFTGDYVYPSTALKLSQLLDLKLGIAFDVMANCSGMAVALENARSLMLTNHKLNCVAVVGIAKQAPFINQYDKNSVLFFGDGASAIILTKEQSENNIGLLAGNFSSHTESYELVRLRAGGSSYPFSAWLELTDPKAFHYEHSGLGVWKEVTVALPKIIKQTLSQLEWSTEDLDLILFHQASLRLLEYCMARLKLPPEKTIYNVQAIGNTADASLGTVIYEAFINGQITPGKKILFATVGAGFIYTVTPYLG